jgi:hypothetical protein
MLILLKSLKFSDIYLSRLRNPQIGFPASSMKISSLLVQSQDFRVGFNTSKSRLQTLKISRNSFSAIVC